jgi:tetratricopeptide (TPR) repeat protein
VADLQRKIRALYATEHYESALELVRDLHEICAEFYGEDHPVSASAINNHALLNKSVGQFAEAVDLFTSAIQSYEASVGERHSSTATALHNLGLTYKAMYESDEHTGVDELNLQDRAEEALHESIGRRESRRDPEAATTMYVLAAVKSAQGFRSEAEGLFEESVSVLRETHEEATNPTNAARLATGLNNFGFWLKTGEDISPDGGREEGGEEGEEANDLAVRNTLNLERALDLYTEAFTLRKEVLGESHVSTIVSMQNIAELLHVQGRTDDAAFLQEKIIEMADKSL